MESGGIVLVVNPGSLTEEYTSWSRWMAAGLSPWATGYNQKSGARKYVLPMVVEFGISISRLV